MWNRHRADTRIPDSVIEDISEKFDNPGKRYLWDNSDLEVDMEQQDLAMVVPEIVEILKDLEPAIVQRPSLITDSQLNKADTETRRIVSRFLEKHSTLRGRREISTIRRRVLRDVDRGNIPVETVGETLLEKLRELL
jgi:O-phosphoseryl-tRNA(Sec) kinase